MFNERALQEYGQRDDINWLGMDGKSLKNTLKNPNNEQQNFIMFVSLFSQESGLVLHLKRIENKKGSEIDEGQAIIEDCSLQNKVFTGDALHCQKKTISLIAKTKNDYVITVKGNHDADYHSNDEILHQMCGDATDINLLEIGDEEILVPCSNGQNTVRSHYSLKRNYDRISNLLQLTEMEQQMYNVTYLERLVSIAARNGFDIKTESPFEAYYRAILRQSIVAGGRNTEEHRNVVSQILSCLAGEDFHIDRRTIDANLSEVCCVSALALFPLLSKINHSCQPNVEVQHGLFKECIVDLVAFSVYDTKPVHFLSMACTGLKWIEKRKKVFDRETGTNVSMAFLRPEVTDMYNNGMNNVDIADQLQGTYRLDRWMRKASRVLECQIGTHSSVPSLISILRWASLKEETVS